MADLQATYSVQLELVKFSNIDLLSRGYYHIRTSYKPNSRLVSVNSVECITVEESLSDSYKFFLGPTRMTSSDGITRAISKTVLIQYKHEQALLSDLFRFTVNLLVESHKTEDQLPSRLEFIFELAYSRSLPESHDSMKVVATEVAVCTLPHLSSLHYHRPVTFDCVYLSAVSITLHAALISLTAVKQADLIQARAKVRQSSPVRPNHFAVLFRNIPVELASLEQLTNEQILDACCLHQRLCSYLLTTYSRVTKNLRRAMGLMPVYFQVKLNPVNVFKKLEQLQRTFHSLDDPEVMLCTFLTDLDNLSLDLSMLWLQYLECFTLNPFLLCQLREDHHHQRTAHLAEGFFYSEFPIDKVGTYSGFGQQQHDMLASTVRNSAYFRKIPNLQVMCSTSDGDLNSTPIIFEDHYHHTQVQPGKLRIIEEFVNISFKNSAVRTDRRECVDSDVGLKVFCNSEDVVTVSEEVSRELCPAPPVGSEKAGWTAAAPEKETVDVPCTGESLSPLQREDDLSDGTSSFSQMENSSVFINGMASSRQQFERARQALVPELKSTAKHYTFKLEPPISPAYFTERIRPTNSNCHLVVCVHGLQGSCDDLRLVRCFLELSLPDAPLHFLMSRVNEDCTLGSVADCAERLLKEVVDYIEGDTMTVDRISFVGHSLGNLLIRGAVGHPLFGPYHSKLWTFLSLSGPHLGLLYHTSSLVSTGIWLIQKFKKSQCISDLSLQDHSDLRQTYLYTLSKNGALDHFKNILLVSSVQDHYVPFHSARLESCLQASRDSSELGQVYNEMVESILSPLKTRSDLNFVRYSVYHAIPLTASSLIGRAAHIAFLDSEIFVERLILLSASKYFI